MIPTASAQYVGAYNVYDDGQIVGATARCSCGIGHYGYETRYFIDCCPHCGGNLAFEQFDPANGVIPGFTSIEGQFFCQNCDMDFCCQCGKEHIIGSQYWLYPSDPPKPPEPVEKQEPKPEPTHLEKLQKIYLDNHKNVLAISNS